MQAPISGEHDWQSAEYAQSWVADAEARDPNRTDQLALLARLIPRPHDAPIRVLDMGAGYGIVTRNVLEVFPSAQVTLLDFSEAMLDHSRSRLAAHAAQLTYAIGDLSRPGWNRELQGPYDAVVSAAALHNLRDGERIAAIYKEMAPLLAPGGAFLNLDHIGAGGPRIARQLALIRPSRRQRSAPADAPAEPRPLRHPGDVVRHLEWLRAAGFAEVDVFWKSFHTTLYGGYMP